MDGASTFCTLSLGLFLSLLAGRLGTENGFVEGHVGQCGLLELEVTPRLILILDRLLHSFWQLGISSALRGLFDQPNSSAIASNSARKLAMSVP